MSKQIIYTSTDGATIIELHGAASPQVLRIMVDRKRIARAIICDLAEPGCYVSHLYVAPAHRRQRWGWYLMQWLVELARRAKCSGISLHVAAQNQAAQSLYHLSGFFIACTTTDKEDPHYLMARAL